MKCNTVLDILWFRINCRIPKFLLEEMSLDPGGNQKSVFKYLIVGSFSANFIAVTDPFYAIGFFLYTRSFLIPANMYLYKVSNRNTTKKCKICSKLTMKVPEQRQRQVGIGLKWVKILIRSVLISKITFQSKQSRHQHKILERYSSVLNVAYRYLPS